MVVLFCTEKEDEEDEKQALILIYYVSSMKKEEEEEPVSAVINEGIREEDRSKGIGIENKYKRAHPIIHGCTSPYS